jgi:hypothetical protein
MPGHEKKPRFSAVSSAPPKYPKRRSSRGQYAISRATSSPVRAAASERLDQLLSSAAASLLLEYWDCARSKATAPFQSTMAPAAWRRKSCTVRVKACGVTDDIRYCPFRCPASIVSAHIVLRRARRVCHVTIVTLRL